MTIKSFGTISKFTQYPALISFFTILVNLGLKKVGAKYSGEKIKEGIEREETRILVLHCRKAVILEKCVSNFPTM